MISRSDTEDFCDIEDLSICIQKHKNIIFVFTINYIFYNDYMYCLLWFYIVKFLQFAIFRYFFVVNHLGALWFFEIPIEKMNGGKI